MKCACFNRLNIPVEPAVMCLDEGTRVSELLLPDDFQVYHYHRLVGEIFMLFASITHAFVLGWGAPSLGAPFTIDGIFVEESGDQVAAIRPMM